MAFNTYKMKSRTVLSEINIIPLVDVMLVLLIMFMVTAPLMQQGLDVDLPETASSGLEVNDKPLILIIKKNKKIIIGEAEQNLEGLRKKLQAIFTNRKNKQLYIQADKSVDYGFVAQTMGEIRAAGIFKIGLVTLPKTD